MPLFEYKCEECGRTYETLAASATAESPACPACGSERSEKLFSVFSSSTGRESMKSGAGDPCSGCSSSGRFT